ncbi:DUF3037 domain-containing protein [Brachybacterium hainanense]|uniref:DUF3037 domain-containing protein n=1 Tax=Brachybacterium hainanense TaxID=1541174 RepID=A0ABV6R7P1_9MICO
MEHRYWTIRYVPDPVRDERVNIGIIVGSVDDQDWAIRHVESATRANHLGGESGRALAYVRALARRVESALLPNELPRTVEPVSTAFIERLRVHQENSVQLSEARTVVAASAEAAMDLIYPLMVEEPPPRQRSVGRQRITKLMDDAFHRRFEQAGVPMRKKVSARASSATGSFDFALGTDGAMQLAQAWSFTVQSMDDLQQQFQSWNWLVSRVREAGAILGRGNDDVMSIAPETPLLVVQDLPKTDQQKEAWEAAQESWEVLGVDVQPTAQLERSAEAMERVLIPV